MDTIPDLTWLTNPWQALVAVVLILAVLVAPGVLAWLNTMKTNHQMQPNSGGSLRDAVDRIEKGLADHIDADRTWKAQVEEMLTGRDA